MGQGVEELTSVSSTTASSSRTPPLEERQGSLFSAAALIGPATIIVALGLLIPVAILYALALTAWFGLRGRLGHFGFYVLFALVVTQSVQLVGIYLVFASLIVPALASKRFSPNWKLTGAYLVGIIGYASGIVASSLLDLPTGAMIVVTLCSAFALSVLLVKDHGSAAT